MWSGGKGCRRHHYPHYYDNSLITINIYEHAQKPRNQPSSPSTQGFPILKASDHVRVLASGCFPGELGSLPAPACPSKALSGRRGHCRISMTVPSIVTDEVLFVIISMYPHHYNTFLFSKSFQSHLQTLVNYLVERVGQYRGQHNPVANPLRSDPLGFKFQLYHLLAIFPVGKLVKLSEPQLNHLQNKMSKIV